MPPPEPGLTAALLYAVFLAWISCFWIAKRTLSTPAACILVSIRIVIPLVYFGMFYDGSWTILDDVTYHRHAIDLSERGFDPINVLVSAEGRDRLMMLSDGPHFLYSWWNLLAHYIFGPYYYSAVFLNIILTFVSNYFLYQLAKPDRFPKSYLSGLQIVFLLHWELLTWSSFLNVKDILVMTLTIMLLYGYREVTRRPRAKSLLLVFLASFLLLWIRSYLILFAFASTVLWVVLRMRGTRKWLVISLAPLGGAIILNAYGLTTLSYYVKFLDPWAIASGFPRMLLTPQPWSIQPEYSFLLFSSAIHWIVIVGLIPGAYLSCRRSSTASLLWTYALLCLCLYAAYPELQGPRHRIQLTPMFSWAIFHFFWTLFKSAKFSESLSPNPIPVG